MRTRVDNSKPFNVYVCGFLTDCCNLVWEKTGSYDYDLKDVLLL